MPGQFDKETSSQNYEWHRERVLREKKKPNAHSESRVEFNLREIGNKHGEKAVREMLKEFNASKPKEKKYFT